MSVTNLTSKNGLSSEANPERMTKISDEIIKDY
jgi:hypothetical protein